MTSPSVSACTLCDGATMGSVPDADVRKQPACQTMTARGQGIKEQLGHHVDDAWTQWSCIINTFHIESCLRSSLYMSRQLNLGVRARALRHNFCLDYIDGGLCTSVIGPSGED